MSSHGRSGSARAAFTFVEVLIAIAVIAMAVVPFFLAVQSGAFQVAETRDYVLAVMIAQRTLEEVRSQNYLRLVPTDDRAARRPPPDKDVVALLNSAPRNLLKVGGVDYTRQVEVRLVPGSRPDQPGPVDARSVTVTVTWTPLRGRSRLTYQVSSLISSALQL